MRKLFLLFIFTLFCQRIQSEEECIALDLETAWQRVLSCAPAIAAADSGVCALEGEKKQVSTLINPILAIEGENIGVSHPNKNTEPPQTTYTLSQLIEFGGKRSARRALASSMVDVAYWDSQIQRQDLRFALTVAFIEMSIAQEKLKIAQDKQEVACKILETINMQVDGGKISPIQTKKASIAVMAEDLALNEALSELSQAKKKLSLMWGSSCPDFDCVIFELFDCSTPPCQSCIIDGLFQTPDFIRAKQMIASAASNLILQKANRVPDVTVTAGYRVFNDSHQHGWVVGAAMPLPLFDTNQGNINKAFCEVNQAEFLLDEIERELKEKILITYEKLCASFEASEIIRKGVLSEMLEAVLMTQEGYQKGKFEYMDLLDAQKMLFEMHEKYIATLYDYHLSRAELARLSGDFICTCSE